MIPVLISSTVEQIVIDQVETLGLGDNTPIVYARSLFTDDLLLDSEDVHAIIMRCEEEFKVSIPDDAITEQSSVGELTELIADLLKEKDARGARAAMMRTAWLDFPGE